MQPFLRVSSYIGTIYHKLSDYLLDIPIFDVLHPNRFAFTFMAKMNAMMDLHKLFGEIIPEQIYSVSEAARYFGVHRCTIYAYISHPEKPLSFTRFPNQAKLLFQGRRSLPRQRVLQKRRGHRPSRPRQQRRRQRSWRQPCPGRHR